MKQIVWQGAKNLPLQVRRPCPCGCDRRDGNHGVGYLIGSDAAGDEVTVWIESEEVFQRLADAIQRQESTRNEP